MKHTTRFVVKGTLQFPVDMLRTDQCFPATSDDVNAMMDNISAPYVDFSENQPDWTSTIGLVHVDVRKGWKPTAQRWESFGWEVVEVLPSISAT